jgi:hypothetical protein
MRRHVLAAVLTALCGFTGCKFTGKSSQQLGQSNANALLSPKGDKILFATLALQEEDVWDFNRQIELATPNLAPKRPLPVCFYEATGLNRDEWNTIATSAGGVFSLPPEVQRTKISPRREKAMDFDQATNLVAGIATDLSLRAETVTAVFSPELERSGDLAISESEFSSLASRLMTESLAVPKVDFSHISCVDGGSDAVQLNFSPLAHKTGNIVLNMLLLFTNYNPDSMVVETTGVPGANRVITVDKINKGKKLLNTTIEYGRRRTFHLPRR